MHSEGAISPLGVPILAPQFYAPTGVALGCPLPNTSVTAYLVDVWRCAARISSLEAVPLDALHITVVNRDHYDAPKRTAGGLRYLSHLEKDAVADLVGDLRLECVETHLLGVSAENGILRASFEATPSFRRLREAILRSFPWLDVKTPGGAHVKLGHALPADANAIESALKTLPAPPEGALRFVDAYTPAGRILF